MKLKKLLISATAVAASSGLLATVLTSCSKSNVEDEKKVTLDDAGKFANLDGATYKDAVKSALSRSSNWATFKSALADEIIYKWYVDRASANKDDDSKNVTFRSNIDEWKYQIDKDYDSVVDTCKSKYGSNYKFYLQNEYLDANGGTVESYKHAKLVEKVRAEFVSKVFATNYFGYATDATDDPNYPHVYTEANGSIDFNKLKDPATWPRLGFYAKVNKSFTVKPTDNINELAKHPDGDYAIIQNYVFNRWFATEKPFFSAASLFKYSTPAESGGKLANIYNTNKTTVPDAPNEAFPFFGGVSIDSNGSTGTNAAYDWYKALTNNEFISTGMYGTAEDKYNGTISIPKKYTEDSQTLLLSYASQMIGGASNALYIPYGVAASKLYLSMLGKTVTKVNELDQDDLAINILGSGAPQGEDDARILSNFFEPASPTGTTELDSYTDLQTLYGNAGSSTRYHCPIFADGRTSDYTFFYGDDNTNGVRFITNHRWTDLSSTATEKIPTRYSQPWILELNEAGMHAQTIDGYYYVINAQTSREEALKQVLKYRLMQKKNNYDDGMISGDIFGDTGALKTYFDSNIANIILEMAMSTDNETNIFRNIDTYAQPKTDDTNKKFLDKVARGEPEADDLDKTKKPLGTVDNLKDYLKQTIDYDRKKKEYDAVVNASDKIYAYRKSQIDNSKSNIGKKIYGNGLLAQLPASYVPSVPSAFGTTHLYEETPLLMIACEYDDPAKIQFGAIDTIAKNIADHAFVKDAINAAINDKTEATNSGFSPLIADAKGVESNRFWFKSPLVDKVMYSYMGTNALVNIIKGSTYNKYQTEALKGNAFDFNTLTNQAKEGVASTYIASKLLTGDKNFASYTPTFTDVHFFDVINNNPNGLFTAYLNQKRLGNGSMSDEDVSFALYNATMSFLAKNGFENFYKTLNSKIADDEMAFVGYVAKYNKYYTNTEIGYVPEDPIEDQVPGVNPFAFNANVENIFDQANYSGINAAPSAVNNQKLASDQYWHVVKNAAGVEQAGFTGIQTKSSNSLDSDSGLQEAVVSKFARSTYMSKTTYVQNQGALFPWAGQKDAEGKDYQFDVVKFNNQEIKWEQFRDNLPAGLKLARKIANSSTLDDLRSIAKSIGSALYGYSIFRDIGNSEYHITKPEDAVNEIKYTMLNELLTNTQQHYDKAFSRLQNVEIHNDPLEAKAYCFTSGANGYKFMLTQINKSDIIEKTITPKYENGAWTMPDTITESEFWYIFANMATESSVQQLAIADAVKTIFPGENKLEIYDAQLYNQFDSVWVKDWEKKPIGGEGA